MALSKLNFNSLNLTPVAGKGIGFDSGADDLEASFSGGAMVFISKSTASSSSTISFTSGIDSTYKEYLFIFNNIHPETNETQLQINMSTDSGSNYNVTKTTSFFRAYHAEADDAASVTYYDGDLAQSTDFQRLCLGIGNANDASGSGYLHLFNPSSTTFVKHFTAQTSENYISTYSLHNFCAGYCNTTSAIDAVQFKMNSGDIDAGTITLYGIN